MNFNLNRSINLVFFQFAKHRQSGQYLITFFLGLFLSIWSTNASAQFGGTINYNQLYGRLGSHFKNAFGINAGYVPEFEEHWRPRVEIQFIPLKSRQEYYPWQGSYSQIPPFTYFPGKVKFVRFDLLWIDLGLDRSIIKRSKFVLYAGISFGFGGANQHRQENNGIRETTANELSGGLHTVIRLGGDFRLTSKMALYTELSGSRAGLSYDTDGAYTSLSLGIRKILTKSK